MIRAIRASAVVDLCSAQQSAGAAWSAVVGNTASAFVAIAVCAALSDPVLRIPGAVGAVIAIMITLRAFIRPVRSRDDRGMSPDLAQESGLWFALSPVALGTAILVVVGVLYGRATGRHYPFRQFEQINPQAHLIMWQANALACLKMIW